MVDFTVIIVTHNRAATLRESLTALARLHPQPSWELLVVDNASTDSTREVVSRAASMLPAPVRYQYEPALGKYAALNNGIRASEGRFIAATDDDGFPREDWLAKAAEGFARFGCGFVGGPVFPIWSAAKPPWIAEKDSLAGKVLALQDYGTAPREYGRSIAWPLGVNVAYRRDVFEHVGLFEGELGRVAGTLRSQAQREWHLRARAAGIRGFYLPEMIVRHLVTPDRLTKAYFRRWFYWHGVSRAILHRHTGLDLFDPDGGAGEPQGTEVAGVPAAVWRRIALSGGSWARRYLRGDATAAFEYELSLAFLAGIVRERWREARAGHGALDAPADAYPKPVTSPCLRGRLTKSAPTGR
jgi:glycosyltransferase involved in cell wall biosynthesis